MFHVPCSLYCPSHISPLVAIHWYVHEQTPIRPLALVIHFHLEITGWSLTTHDQRSRMPRVLSRFGRVPVTSELTKLVSDGLLIPTSTSFAIFRHHTACLHATSTIVVLFIVLWEGPIYT